RSVIGRQLVAVGFSPEAARYAAIPVGRRLTLVYVLSGLVSSIAAIIYVAHLGQAKANAGTGYELLAITAVVLGGTSIFGGRGTVHGTLLGLFAIAVLQNGLRMADLPAELAGILTGLLLLSTIVIDWLLTRPRAPQPAPDEELDVKNSQVAVLSAVILGGALIIAGSNWYLVRSLNSEGRAGSRERPVSRGADAARPAKTLTVAVIPKSKGNAYLIDCRQGAVLAGNE